MDYYLLQIKDKESIKHVIEILQAYDMTIIEIFNNNSMVVKCWEGTIDFNIDGVIAVYNRIPITEVRVSPLAKYKEIY